VCVYGCDDDDDVCLCGCGCDDPYCYDGSFPCMLMAVMGFLVSVCLWSR